MNIIRIAGAVASKSGITLYLENGKEISLPKNSHRTNEIMQKIAKPLARKKIVELDLDQYSAHAMIERKTGGLIRFVKQKVSDFLGFKGAAGGALGMIPLKNDETVVAMVGDKKIPGMGALSRQIEYAAFTKDCKGFKLFMKRLAAVIDERGHSVQELLSFMQKGDLPIADDGSIIAYKTLRYYGASDSGVFVDIHSQVVRQKLGSRVSMPMKDVDESRRTQCSTGLHIARRSYLRHYFGDLLTLVKVAPEDVIAVPSGEPDKMRAAAYHIVAVLPKYIAEMVRSDRPMTTDKEAAKILANIVAGDHVGVLEEVRVSNDKIEKPSSGQRTSYASKSVETERRDVATPFLGAGDNGLAAALDDTKNTEVDIRALNKQIEEVVTEQPKKKRKAKATSPAKKSTDMQKKREQAYQAVLGGMSQREAAKQFKVCAKTLRKMVRERLPKAAE